MSSAQYPKSKTWAEDEDLTTHDLNAHVDNERANLNPPGVGGYSDTVSQMRIQTSPGAVGSESMSRSLSDEIERLRYELVQVTGKTYWYESPTISLAQANSLINQIQAVPSNRIVSGRVRSGSAQPMFLVPDGTVSTVNLKGASTPFVSVINGTTFTLSSDIAITGLSLAPASNNTALVNNSRYGGQWFTRQVGEESFDLDMDAAGSEITALVGKWAAFKIVGAGTEYFFGFVKSATAITHCYRGFFFTSADAPVKRTTITDNDTITLMKLTWVFYKNDNTLTVTYNNPTWSHDQPVSGSVGDFWYDMVNTTWKTFNGSSWVASNALFAGICFQDTAGTKGARSADTYAAFSDMNTVEVEVFSNTQAQGSRIGPRISVYGNQFMWDMGMPLWDVTSDLAGSSEMYSATLQASTMYYLYISETGDRQISDMSPFLREDLRGYYHPFNPWRCVGLAYSDASSHITNVSSILKDDSEVLVTVANGYGATGTATRRWTTLSKNKGASIIYVDDANAGGSFTIYRNGTYSAERVAGFTASGTVGIAINSTDLTADASGFPQEVALFTSGASFYTNPTGTKNLFVGDVIRAQDSVLTDFGGANHFMRVCKVG